MAMKIESHYLTLPDDIHTESPGAEGHTRVAATLTLFTDILRRMQEGGLEELRITATTVEGDKLTWVV